MLVVQVGFYAGAIWKALEGQNSMTQKEIKKIAKLKDKEFYLGLGWLLREDKLNINQESDVEEIYYSLK